MTYAILCQYLTISPSNLLLSNLTSRGELMWTDVFDQVNHLIKIQNNVQIIFTG